MTESSPQGQGMPPLDWHRLHAFGWPAGSVRALMAILIFGVLWTHLLLRPDRGVPESLKDLLFIILGHYFAVRSRQGSEDEPGPPPLYLPRGAVRLLLIAGFVAVSVVLFRQGRLLQPARNPGVVTLLLVFGFLLGVVIQKVATLWSGRKKPLPRLIEDARAFVSLGAALLLVVLICDQLIPFLPAVFRPPLARLQFGLGKYGPEHLLAAVVGFYFGSRS